MNLTELLYNTFVKGESRSWGERATAKSYVRDEGMVTRQIGSNPIPHGWPLNKGKKDDRNNWNNLWRTRIML